MKDNGYCRVLLRDGIGKMNSSDILFVKDVTVVLQKEVSFCGKDDLKFRPGRENH